MSELLTCPFCGGEAEVLTAESMNGGYLFGIMCNDCGARGDVYDTEAEAVAAWNSRAERTCKFVSSKGSDYPPVCDVCGYELGIYDCEWFEDGTYGYGGNYCPNCGARVVSE